MSGQQQGALRAHSVGSRCVPIAAISDKGIAGHGGFAAAGSVMRHNRNPENTRAKTGRL